MTSHSVGFLTVGCSTLKVNTWVLYTASSWCSTEHSQFAMYEKNSICHTVGLNSFISDVPLRAPTVLFNKLDLK